MRKKLLAAILFAAGCGSSPQPKTTTPAPTPSASTDQTQAPAPTPAATTASAGGEAIVPTPGNPPAPPKAGAPEIGTWGFDLKGMNTKVKPGQGFYDYANGTWLTTTPIPEDKSNYGMFTVLADKSDERTKEIILGAKGKAGTDAKKIADFYSSFMDEAGIEKKGIAPIKGELAKIKAIKTNKELMPTFGYFARHFRTSPFGTIVGQDDKAPETHIANIGQDGLGLPDRDMYDAKN
ncbi:MAG TPA: M13 family metallopeptidase N-terminal domain-containing protein, partial [Kofleriaceae bacterium]